MAHNTHENDEGVPVGAIAAGVLAAGAVAAAGYYFYGSKHAQQHRKDAVAWAHDVKKDVVQEAKRFQGLGEEAMHLAIDRVVSRVTEGSVDQEALQEVVRELKGNWKKVRAEALGKKKKPAKKKMASKTKKVMKKART